MIHKARPDIDRELHITVIETDILLREGHILLRCARHLRKSAVQTRQPGRLQCRMHGDPLAPIQIHVDRRFFLLTWDLRTILRHSYRISEDLRPVLVGGHQLKNEIARNGIGMRIVQKYRRLLRYCLRLSSKKCHRALHLKPRHSRQAVLQHADRIGFTFLDRCTGKNVVELRKQQILLRLVQLCGRICDQSLHSSCREQLFCCKQMVFQLSMQLLHARLRRIAADKHRAKVVCKNRSIHAFILQGLKKCFRRRMHGLNLRLRVDPVIQFRNISARRPAAMIADAPCKKADAFACLIPAPALCILRCLTHGAVVRTIQPVRQDL